MTLVPYIGFAVVALLAFAFVAVPVWRKTQKRGRFLLLAALGVAMLGVGGGTYIMVGRPSLAKRQAEGLNSRDVKALIPELITLVRKTPTDVRAWRYLAQVYMTSNDPADAAKALAKAVTLTGKGDAELDAAYGEALVLANGGAVPDEAEAAFQDALKIEPSSPPARFYLGLARVQHNDKPAAIAYWQSLLADVSPASRLHQMLVDRIAALTSASGGMPAGGPRAMVAMLAARLKADPNDPLGWVRLMRAYSVLGETDKAKEALATARQTFKDNKDALTAFQTAATALKLD